MSTGRERRCVFSIVRQRGCASVSVAALTVLGLIVRGSFVPAFVSLVSRFFEFAACDRGRFLAVHSHAMRRLTEFSGGRVGVGVPLGFRFGGYAAGGFEHRSGEQNADKDT